jgi:hypothetical protein
MTSFIVLGCLLLMFLLLWVFTRQVRERKDRSLRPISAFRALRGLLGRAAESGKAVHLALGSSGLGSEQTVVGCIGLTVLNYLAEQGVAFGASPIVTVSDPMLMLAAQNVLYRAYQRKGLAMSYRSTDVHMIAPEPTAYIVGAQETVSQEDIAANVMIGSFGEEYLLLGEDGAQREMMQVVGSNSVSAQPWMLATSDHVLLGEELFAAGAYLNRRPTHIASLYLQDTLRILLVIVITIGVLIKTVLG